MREKILLMAIVLLGIFLRLNNITPFKIYPDSYQNLLVTKNIMDYHSVVGYLGPNGMLFPDFFTWTRPGYALLINIFNLFTKDMTFAALIVSFFLGIVTIPAVFLFIKNVFHKTSYALAGAFLLAISFSHTVWGGFIMTETTGVCFMILFLWSLFSSLSKKTSIANHRDLLTGFLFVCAVITRYEYVLIALPVIFFIAPKNKITVYRLINICVAFLVGIVFVVLQLFPLESSFAVIQSQLLDLLKIAGVLVLISLLFVLLIKFLPKHILHIVKNSFDKIILVLIWIVALLLILQLIIGPQVAFWGNFYFVRNFAIHDFLISIFAFIGLSCMLRKSSMQNLNIFVLFSLIALGYFYYKVNPEMDRYMTHLIPFLLIPASYGFVVSLREMKQKVTTSLRAKRGNLKNKVIASSFLLAMTIPLILQAIISYNGLHATQDSSWFRSSYEEKSANKIKKIIPQQKNNMLLVSLPEPYYYNSHLSTQSITDTYPYIYIDNSLDKQTIFLVSDMPMHIIFPEFSKFITNNLDDYKIKQFWIHEKYHYINNIYEEKYPVVLYKISLEELKSKIAKAHL